MGGPGVDFRPSRGLFLSPAGQRKAEQKTKQQAIQEGKTTSNAKHKLAPGSWPERLLGFSSEVFAFNSAEVFGFTSAEEFAFHSADAFGFSSAEVLGFSSEVLGFSSEVCGFSSEVLGFSFEFWALALRNINIVISECICTVSVRIEVNPLFPKGPSCPRSRA